MKLLSAHLPESETMIEQTVSKEQFYQSTKQMSDAMINFADQHPDALYQLSLCDIDEFHAIGFCKKAGRYHFFDANFGWVVFEASADFKLWFNEFF